MPSEVTRVGRNSHLQQKRQCRDVRWTFTRAIVRACLPAPESVADGRYALAVGSLSDVHHGHFARQSYPRPAQQSPETKAVAL